MLATGQVVQEDAGGFFVYVPCRHHKEQVRTSRRDVTIEFDDGRGITGAQRRKAYVLLNAIAEWWGHTPMEAIKEITKLYFLGTGFTLKDWFSLSNTDRTVARLYITFLIDFCLLNDIPCGEPLWKVCEDIPKYVYACLMNKRCAVCGKKAQLHHVGKSRIGMGRNRREVPQIGMWVLPLCATHHNEAHQGEADFAKRYLLEAVQLTEQAADVYRLTKRNKRKASAMDVRVPTWQEGK